MAVPAVIAAENLFRACWDLGYRRLVPITPPDAEVSERSSLRRSNARGKAPGIRGPDDLWRGFDWAGYEAADHDVDRWHKMGAGVGFKTGLQVDGTSLIAIDADVLDKDVANDIWREIVRTFGRLPVRIGSEPKALYLIRTSGPLPYSKLRFAAGAIEILSDGRQFVAHGIHPRTLAPYFWAHELVPFDALPVVAPEVVPALLTHLAALLPGAAAVSAGANRDRTAIDQDALRGDIGQIASALRATPNDTGRYGYDDWIKFAVALRAGCAEDPELGRDLFCEFSERASIPEPTCDPETTYWSLKPPFSIAADFIYAEAEKHGGWTGRTAANHQDVVARWFDDSVASAAVDAHWSEVGRPALLPAPVRATPFRVSDPRTLPRREWLYGQHYIRKYLSATVAPGGLGKSSLIIVEALAMVTGKPLLGVQPRGTSRVWLWNGEDPLDELERRVGAVMLHYRLTADDIGDRLFLDSGRNLELVIAKQEQRGAVIQVPVADAITREMIDRRIDVLILDPFVSSHRVNENDNGAIDLVSKQWARIADATNASIELVHHVRKRNGTDVEISPEDSRGASALIATARSARTLNPMSKSEAEKFSLEDHQRSFFRFGDSKSNLAPPPAGGSTVWFQFVPQRLGNDGVDADGRFLEGDSVGVVTRFTGADKAESSRAAELTAAIADIKPHTWKEDSRAGDAWIGTKLAVALGLDRNNDNDKGRLRTIIKGLIDDKLLVRKMLIDPDRRKPRVYVELPDGSPKASEGGVFA